MSVHEVMGLGKVACPVLLDANSGIAHVQGSKSNDELAKSSPDKQ